MVHSDPDLILRNSSVLIDKEPQKLVASDCRQTPKFGVLFAVFLFYCHLLLKIFAI